MTREPPGEAVVDPGSFRDPAGFVFRRDGVLYRQVNAPGRAGYDLLMSSGLYERLARDDLLVTHEEVEGAPAAEGAYKLLRPALIPFVSYPYEWSFSQLQDAALLTLRAQRRALAAGLTLKDASAYNVQFRGGRPVLIDTLSFEPYAEGRPWAGYRQFCQHFLAPLALMSLRDVRLGDLARVHVDGVPLDLCSALLPWTSWLRYSLLAHVHLHAATQRRYAGRGVAPAAVRVSRRALEGLLESLEAAVSRLRWRPAGTEWADYYEDTNYDEAAAAAKREGVLACLDDLPAGATVWDLGSNDGTFSRLAAERAGLVVAFDLDPAAVEKNYLRCRAERDARVLPLRLDLTNPSPALGWALEERASLVGRGPADAVLALALIHHLAIGANVPLERVAAFLAQLGERLVIEFVPKEDSQVQRLLASREDIFPSYDLEGFERAFAPWFTVERRLPLPGSSRVLFRMRRRAREPLAAEPREAAGPGDAAAGVGPAG